MNPTEDEDQNGNVEPVNEEPKNSQKILKKHLETGSRRCKNALCNVEIDK